MSAILLGFGGFVVPTDAQADIAVAANFERFDGLDVPATNPAGHNDPPDPLPMGSDENGFGTPPNIVGGVPQMTNPTGAYPRPGEMDSPDDGQVYTRGPLKGLTNTLGGAPLPVNDWKFRGRRTYTPGKTNSIQHRLGDGQNNGGAAQTVTLSQITGNPPVPGDLSGIIAGQG